MSRALFLCVLILLSSRARAQLVLNEVLYDPAGSDGGKEFVELLCTGDAPISLDGVRLVFINGADPEKPKTLWSGSAGMEVAPGAFFVLGEAEVEERDLELVLGLQNGPDALWLMRGETSLDRLAWGELEGWGEGAPAPDPSSTSLGRVPDGLDSDDNQSDWQPLPVPSPGSPNAEAENLRPRQLEAEPPWRSHPGSVRFELLLVAEGYAAMQSAELRWSIDESEEERAELSAARGESLRTQLETQLGPGRHFIRVETIGNDSSPFTELSYQVGVSELRLNEVMARPAAGDPEWIELRYAGSPADTLDGWSFSDATRNWRELPALHWSAGGFAILSADARAMRTSHSLPAGLPVFEAQGAWPTLNNGNQAGEDFADEILLRDAEGVVVDRLLYREDELPEQGRTLERGRVVPGRARDWFASPGMPTPGEENLSAAYAPPESGLLVRPDPFTPDGDGEDDLLHIQLRGSPFAGELLAEIRDLAGERVADLGLESGDAELQQWIWDGRDLAGRPVPMGAYLVVVTGGGKDAPPRGWRALIALGRRS